MKSDEVFYDFSFEFDRHVNHMKELGEQGKKPYDELAYKVAVVNAQALTVIMSQIQNISEHLDKMETKE